MRIYLTYIYIYTQVNITREIKFLPKYIKLLTTRRNYEPYQRKYITRDSSNAAAPLPFHSPNKRTSTSPN